MLYYRTDDKRGKAAGVAAGVSYILLWLMLMLFVNFSFERPDTGGGILIDFGDTDSASGLMDPDLSDVVDPADPDRSVPDPDDTQYLTQDWEDAPEIQQPERPRREPEATPREVDPTPSTTPPSEQPRQVNQQALFPGRTEGSTSQSEGSAQTGAGNQGSQDGSPGGDHGGTGTGSGAGAGFSLAGRTVVGSLTLPAYGSNKEGRVVVDITVNPAGRVTNAVYRAAGSNTNDEALVQAAIRAARQSSFNKIEGDQNQTGTITYTFRLK